MTIKEKQRLNIKQMTALTSNKSGYTPEEVRDVLETFYEVMRNELYKGNSILFEKLMRIEIVKPTPKRMRSLTTGKIVLSPAHPKIKVTASVGLLDYIRSTSGSLLKVKRGTPNKRLQHHKGKEQGEYYAPKEKVYENEFPLPQ